MVGNCHPCDLSALEAPQWKLHTFSAHPQPHLTRRAQLREALEDRRDRAVHSLVGIEQHLAVALAPHEAGRSAPSLPTDF
jgi:hypothetical protein